MPDVTIQLSGITSGDLLSVTDRPSVRKVSELNLR